MSDTSTTHLVITIDTEEDNWGQHRSGITCENIRQIPRLQELFEQFNVIPTYLVTYQVCMRVYAVSILNDIRQRGKCEIGAHLHPWNTPPEEELLTAENSFLKNLPYELQLKKLQNLTDKIEDVFSVQPRSFRTGRWGLGKKTVNALLQCGYRVDSSVTPTLSWKEQGNGPDYKNVETDPYFLSSVTGVGTTNGSIIEIPAAVGYNRWPFSFWDRIFRVAEHQVLRPFHLVGLLNRTAMLQKLWLSPEGFTAEHMITLAKLLIQNNKRVLNLSFHSNTLLKGLTPFVTSDRDVESFYDRLAALFEYLHQATDLRPIPLSEVEVVATDKN